MATGISRASIREELRQLDLRPKRGLGQNFLVEPAYLAAIVDAALLTAEDLVLEIGPGLGTLTELLAASAGRVVAVELDPRLITYLRARFATREHVAIVRGDILEATPEHFLGAGHRPFGQYKVVANLPYYITAAVLRHLVEAPEPPASMVLTVQREVAERMVASPPRMSLLALGVQFFCTPEIVARIPAAAFHPVPKVDSAVVRLVRREQHAFPGIASESFFRVARAGFCQPRKQLRNSLAAGLEAPHADAERWLAAAGISAKRRAETLSIEEWGELAVVVDTGRPRR